ncbi:MAG: DUF6056 family protein [Eubacteriales bacterium]|jgi:hypothetical protein
MQAVDTINAGSRVKRILKNPLFLYVACGLIFGLCMSQVPITHDDALWVKNPDIGSLSFLVDKMVDDYHSWSSRVIINFIALFMVGHGPVCFGIFMGFSLFLFQYSLYAITDGKIRKWMIPAAACFALLLPYEHFGDAGWIITACTYYTPAVFGVFSLVALARICRGEKIRKWEYPLFSFALIYACNHEQQVALYIIVYLVFLVYFCVNHRRSRYFIVQLLLVIASAVFILTCPGNYARANYGQGWMWYYGMFDFLDKLDLGYSLTGLIAIYENFMLLPVLTLLVAVMVWKKYTAGGLRFLSAVPFLCVLTNTFRGLRMELSSVGESGFVTVPAVGSVTSLANRYVQFMFYTVFFISLLLTFMLIANNSAEMTAYIGLIVGGIASRTAMGFTPTVCLSGSRTMTSFLVALIVCLMTAWSSSVSSGYLRREDVRVMNPIMLMMACLWLIDVAIYIV